MPATNWARPPNISATPNTTGSTPALMNFALIMLSMNVVTANAANASGAELPHASAPSLAAGLSWADGRVAPIRAQLGVCGSVDDG